MSFCSLANRAGGNAGSGLRRLHLAVGGSPQHRCAGAYVQAANGVWQQENGDGSTEQPGSHKLTYAEAAGRWVVQKNSPPAAAATAAAPASGEEAVVLRSSTVASAGPLPAPDAPAYGGAAWQERRCDGGWGVVPVTVAAGAPDDEDYAGMDSYVMGDAAEEGWTAAGGRGCDDERASDDVTVSTVPNASDDGRPESRLSRVRHAVHRAMEDPQSSHGALAFAAVSLVAIVASTLTLLIETLPKHQAESRRGEGPWFGLETGFVAFFTTEILLRLWATDRRCAFFQDMLNIVDIAAVLPYYMEVAAGGESAGGLRVLRVVRIVRVFRLLKVARYAEGIRLFLVVIGQLGDVLLLVLFVVSLSLVLWGSCVFYIETVSVGTFDEGNNTWSRNNIYLQGGRTEHSPFQSIPGAFWWCITSVTVVGYGDAVPYSGGAKAVAAAAMLSATFIIAIPAAVFGSTFLSEYQLRMENRLAVKQRADAHRTAGVVQILDFLLEAASTNALEPAVYDDLVTHVMWSTSFATRAVLMLEKEALPLQPSFLAKLVEA
eukprot:Rhum_TRINITY_DN20677_c0_g1::Rhum_TRINITY_DN20677_c0_g1_i1::g.171743::m.171743